MADKPKLPGREARLRSALRENLKRRKAQAKGRAAGEATDARAADINDAASPTSARIAEDKSAR